METPVNDDGEKASSLFKSYYVVWKRISVMVYNISPVGLNRTM